MSSRLVSVVNQRFTARSWSNWRGHLPAKKEAVGSTPTERTMNCFSCDYEGSRKGLGIHYGSKPDHRKSITPEQKEIVTGLLMGDGSINKSSSNPRLRAEMINREYLEYLDSEFPHISCGVTKSKTASEQAEKHRQTGFNNSAKEENYSDCYWWETMSHQDFDEFYNWYGSDGKTFPYNLELTPTILKHWYVCDGTFTNNMIKIYVGNEEKYRNKINKYFNDIGIDSISWSKIERGDRSHTSINFTVDNSDKLFDYMGGSLPGFEYKWPDRKI